MSAIADLARFFSNHPLTRDDPVNAWVRFASWQIKSRLQDEVIVNWIGGQRLAVRRGMTGATGNIYTGLHEFADMMLPLHFLRSGELFLDVGANVGTFTVLASGICKARTWAFEPDPDTVRHLQRNITINNIGALATVHETALGATDGEVRFTVGLDTINRVATSDDKSVRAISQKRLDDLIEGEKPVMIKIDVEGAEENVLKGAAVVLALDSLQVLELETVTPGIDALLARHGFKRAYYDPFRRRLERTPITTCPASNSVFVKNWDWVSRRVENANPVEIFGRKI